jgi:hypothetical protein
MATEVTTVADHLRMTAHRALYSEKAEALAAANAQVSEYATELQRIATKLREVKVAVALGEASSPQAEVDLRAQQAALEAKYAEAQDVRATLTEVMRRLDEREAIISSEVTTELIAEVRRRDGDLVPMVMSLAETLIDLNKKRADLHRLGLDPDLLPLMPELLPGGRIAAWVSAAQAAGFQPARK